MKSLIPAVIVIVLEAGFLFSVAVLPAPAGPVMAAPQAAAARPAAVVRAAPAPAARPATRT